MQDIGRPLYTFVNQLIICFGYCYYGQHLTSSFETIERTIGDMAWYLMPIEVQKKLPSMLLISQKPVYMKGVFTSIKCSYEFFLNVNLFFIQYFLLLYNRNNF